MQSSWKPKRRDYEIEKVKYKNTFISTTENPLLKIEYTRKNNSSENNLPISKVKKAKKKVDDPLSMGNNKIVGKKEKSDPLSITNTSNSNVNKSTEVSVSKTNISNSKPYETIVSLPNKSYSLIIKDNNPDNFENGLEESWKSMKDNLLSLFCSNQDLVVKSLVSVSMDDEEDLKSYKIDKGRTRLEELESKEKSGYNITTSREYVAKLEVLKREMFIVSKLKFKKFK
jgi:hypothetical protein